MTLLYFPTGNLGFAGFLAFAPYFYIYKDNDERNQKNVEMATRNAFLWMIISSAFAIAYVGLTRDPAYLQSAFMTVFVGSLSVCIISYIYYNSR